MAIMVKTEEKRTKKETDEEVRWGSYEGAWRPERRGIVEIQADIHWLGRLEKPYHSEIDPTVTPVVNPPITVPEALRDRVKEELDDMEKQGVARKLKEPTDLVNSVAIVEKPNGSLRICLDPRHLNKAIKREHFQLPSIEDITTRMANTCSANWGYWHIPLNLDKEIQLLTIFNSVSKSPSPK